MNEFFLVALPGLEDLVEAELKDWFPQFESRPEHGGVSVRASLGEGLAMNLVLKTPTRILLRLKSFRCRDFPKLFKACAEFPWDDFLSPDVQIKAHASTRLSRLKIKKRIEETCEAGYRSVRTGGGPTVDLYVRFVNDECTLSLDTSGERLHKRGQRKFIGEAPLRETIAAALILELGRLSDGPVEVIDPMMGSGTFLLEAAFRDEVVSAREFAFQNFREGPALPPKLQAVRPAIEELIGFEKDPKTIRAAQENLKGLPVQIIAEDLFGAEALKATTRQRWILCNPPYGERLKVKEPLPELYARLFAQCEKIARPDLACFLLPAKAVKGKFTLPMGWKVLKKRPFLNGGIPVVAFVFGRSGVDRSGV